jgi:hypothetical protein
MRWGTAAAATILLFGALFVASELSATGPALTWRVSLGPDCLRATTSIRANWIWSRPSELHSVSSDGKLDVEQLTAADSTGREVVVTRGAHERGSVVRLPSGTARCEFTIPLQGHLVRGNISHGYAGSDGALVLPLNRYFFGCDVVLGARAPALAPDLLARGILVDGPLREIAGSDAPLAALSVECVRPSDAERLCAWTGDALVQLSESGIPVPERRPTLLIVPVTSSAARFELGLRSESEVYAVEASSTAPCESTFRDLSRSAVERLARRRPKAERTLWRSMASTIALGLESRVDPAAAERQRERIQRAYESMPPIRAAPSQAASFVGDMAWITEDIIAPRLWDEYLRETVGTPEPWDWLREVMAAGPEDPIDLWIERRFGASNRLRFEQLLNQPGVHLRTAPIPEARRFPLADSIGERLDQDRHSERYRFVFTALGMGFLDNCGCARSQSGGLPRRRTAIEQMRQRDPSVVVLELGDFLAPPLSDMARTVAQSEAAIEILAGCNYSAVVPGVAELSCDPDWLVATCLRQGLPMTAANVKRADGTLVPWPEHVIVQVGGREVHVVGIVEPAFDRFRREALEKRVLPNWELEPVLPALRRALSNARRDQIWVCAGSITAQSVEQILADPIAANIDAIFSCAWRLHMRAPTQDVADAITLLDAPQVGRFGGAYYCYPLLERFGLTTSLLEIDRRGQLVLGQSRGITLPPELPRHVEAVLALDRLARLEAGDAATWQASPLSKLAAERRGDTGYAGSEACRACHERQHSQWLSTPHARAVSALAAKAREFDPACLRCHTTGFLLGGYDPTWDERQRFENVQCETCHGPGALHVERAQMGDVQAAPLRRLPTNDVCVCCHDEANSPTFDFEQRIHHVKHH